jgi:hypothetical protein
LKPLFPTLLKAAQNSIFSQQILSLQPKLKHLVQNLQPDLANLVAAVLNTLPRDKKKVLNNSCKPFGFGLGLPPRPKRKSLFIKQLLFFTQKTFQNNLPKKLLPQPRQNSCNLKSHEP